MNDVHRIDMRPVWVGGRSGYRYDLFHDGQLVVERSRAPLGDAARWCDGEGKNGILEVWRYGGSGPDMIAEIDRHRRLTIEDSDRGGPRFVRWRPFNLEEGQADG